MPCISTLLYVICDMKYIWVVGVEKKQYSVTDNSSLRKLIYNDYYFFS